MQLKQLFHDAVRLSTSILLPRRHSREIRNLGAQRRLLDSRLRGNDGPAWITGQGLVQMPGRLSWLNWDDFPLLLLGPGGPGAAAGGAIVTDGLVPPSLCDRQSSGQWQNLSPDGA